MCNLSSFYYHFKGHIWFIAIGNPGFTITGFFEGKTTVLLIVMWENLLAESTIIFPPLAMFNL